MMLRRREAAVLRGSRPEGVDARLLPPRRCAELQLSRRSRRLHNQSRTTRQVRRLPTACRCSRPFRSLCQGLRHNTGNRVHLPQGLQGGLGSATDERLPEGYMGFFPRTAHKTCENRVRSEKGEVAGLDYGEVPLLLPVQGKREP